MWPFEKIKFTFKEGRFATTEHPKKDEPAGGFLSRPFLTGEGQGDGESHAAMKVITGRPGLRKTWWRAVLEVWRLRG